MSPGPLRRLLGAVGLVLLAPIALRLVDGSMAPVDAALRAAATLLAVVVVGRLLGSWLGQVAHGYDRQATSDRVARARSDEPTESAAA